MYRPAHEVLFDQIDQIAEQMIQFAESGDSIGVNGESLILHKMCVVLEEMIVPEKELPELVNRLQAVVKSPKATDCPSLVARIRELLDKLNQRIGTKIIIPQGG